jgi:hypothetical protein
MFATATALAARASPAISPSPPRARRASSSRSTRAVSHRVRASSTIAPSMPPLENDAKGVERLKLREDGWKFWRWRDHRCHYISAGEDNDGPIVVLVHGFGAHSYHWRYTIPALARKGFRVYALCMLGYGWSPKVEEPYSMEARSIHWSPYDRVGVVNAVS